MARLVQLGTRKSHYFGQVKTRFQLILASTVANLTLTASKTSKMRPGNRAKGLPRFLLSLLRRGFNAIRTYQLGLRLPIRALSGQPQPGFRPHF